MTRDEGTIFEMSSEDVRKSKKYKSSIDDLERVM